MCNQGQLVYVVVINWNKKQETIECIESILKQDYEPIKVLVIDNGSVDGSATLIKSRYPNVVVIKNQTNLGYVEGSNIGIQYAFEENADYILLLNNDTVVNTNMVDILVATAKLDKKIGAVGAKILYYDDSERLWSAGGEIRYTETVTRLRGYHKKDRGQYNRIEEVDYVPGCAMLIRREAVKYVGLFDPIFSPAYFEDTDWCVRASKVGYKILYQPKAEVFHKVSSSSGGEYNVTERYLIGYNSIAFLRYYAGLQQWLKFIVFAIGSLPFVYLIRCLQGQGKSVVAKAVGIFDGFRRKRRNTYLRNIYINP